MECSLVRFLLGWFLKSLSVAPTAGVNEWEVSNYPELWETGFPVLSR